jgi:hypothetical protein
MRIRTPILPGKRIEVCIPELPESGMVELVVYLPDTSDTWSLEPLDTASHSRYPDTLDAEYHALVKTQWSRSLTAQEAEQLEAIKAEMNAIDAASSEARGWEERIDRLEQMIERVAHQIDALPDAS